jgi:hypothetical protein
MTKTELLNLMNVIVSSFDYKETLVFIFVAPSEILSRNNAMHRLLCQAMFSLQTTMWHPIISSSRTIYKKGGSFVINVRMINSQECFYL